MSVHTSPWPEEPKATRPGFSPLGFITAYEAGEIDDEDTLAAGFQFLIDSGIVWNLQGSYARTAIALADAGLVTL